MATEKKIMTQILNSQHLVVVLGLGLTGMSCVRYLHAEGYRVCAMDTREVSSAKALQAQYPEINFIFGHFDEALIQQASALIVSPGIALSHPMIAKCIAQGTPVYGDIELFAQNAKAPIVVISGTNGKSTVTTLLSKMVMQSGLQVRVGGNLGPPALDLLAVDIPDFYILELSSFQLETTFNLCPYSAALLNISPDHLDRYATLTDYVNTKHRIYHGAKHIIYNHDDELTWPADILINAKQLSFTLSLPEGRQWGLLQHQEQDWISYIDERIMPTTDIKLQGRHHVANVLCAFALGDTMRLPREKMIAAVDSFTGIEHRCQHVVTHQGVRWVNDSKGTNLGATQAAIVGIADEITGDIILIAGGQNKGISFSQLNDCIDKYVSKAILIGESAELMAKVWQGRCQIKKAATLDDAVKQAGILAHKGDCVLLSPVCASFDMFVDYQERGHQFMQSVYAWIANKQPVDL